MSSKRIVSILLLIAAGVGTFLAVQFSDPQRGFRESGKYRIFTLEGRSAPAFDAKIVGQDATFQSGKIDKPTLLVFFGTFCPHCKDQMPAVRQTAQKLGDRANVFAVNGREFGNMALPEREERVAKYLAEHDWADLPTLIASVEMQKALAIEAVPCVVLIDGSGTIRYVGLANHTASRLQSLIEETM